MRNNIINSEIKYSESNMSGSDLFDASQNGDLTKVKRLLDSGADVNWQDWVWDISYCIILYSGVHCSY